MSAAKQRRPNRAPSRQRSAPRHVEPVLDPTWHNPYAPSPEEREANRKAIRVSVLRRGRALYVAATVIFVASVVVAVAGLWSSSIGGWWWPLVGVAVVALAYAINEMRARRLEGSILDLADSLRNSFAVGGSVKDRLRLGTIVDRLNATFGISDVKAIIIADPVYNAALLPDAEGFTLLVTSGLMSDFELVEIEGVIAHLMARQRLNLLEREAAACVSNLGFDEAHLLAGTAVAYRADEVAAAAVRYPQGLSQALARCAAQNVAASSYFAGKNYEETRWVWFNQFADSPSTLEGDLDNALVRSRALAEW